jgi:HK97 gp10 family phage protein
VGGDETVAALDAMIARMAAVGPIAVRQGALMMQRAGMARTPVKQGTLRRSWQTGDVYGSLGVYAVQVGPTAVYARRIELGFKGADSLGRTYNQQPKPYVRPAYVETAPKILALIRNQFANAITGG